MPIYRCNAIVTIDCDGNVRNCDAPAVSFHPDHHPRRLYCGWHSPIDAPRIEMIDAYARRTTHDPNGGTKR